jgi:hypothetical protein
MLSLAECGEVTLEDIVYVIVHDKENQVGLASTTKQEQF